MGLKVAMAVKFVNRRFDEDRSMSVISGGRDIPISGIGDIVAELFGWRLSRMAFDARHCLTDQPVEDQPARGRR